MEVIAIYTYEFKPPKAFNKKTAQIENLLNTINRNTYLHSQKEQS